MIHLLKNHNGSRIYHIKQAVECTKSVKQSIRVTKFLYENVIHIGLISETWLRPHIKFNIRGYSVVRNDCGNSHYEIAILIHNIYNTRKSISTFLDNSLQNVAVRLCPHSDISPRDFFPRNSVTHLIL